MGLAARIVADGFNYDIVQRGVPKLDMATGQPTGEIVQTRVVVISDGLSAIEVVFTEDDWTAFKQRVNDSQIQIATELPAALVLGNGHH